jgi:hypothetical protein
VHSGTKSCKACITVGGTSVLENSAQVTFAAGDTFIAEAWLRNASGGVEPTSTSLHVQLDSAGGVLFAGPETAAPPLSGTFVQVQAQAIAPDAGDGASFRLRIMSGATGSCFLIDDAVLRRGP